MTDIRRAKELLGDRMARMGNVPTSLLALGDPDGLRRHVRELVPDCGPIGLLASASLCAVTSAVNRAISDGLVEFDPELALARSPEA